MIYTDFHEDYGFQHVPFMFSLLFYHRECSNTDSNHRNKFSLNQNHGIYPFWRPAHATMNIQNLCFLRSYNKKKHDMLGPPGKVDDLIHLLEA